MADQRIPPYLDPIVDSRPIADFTLRDYFAAAVAPAFAREFLAAGDTWNDYDDVAKSIYHIADAMLRQRERLR